MTDRVNLADLRRSADVEQPAVRVDRESAPHHNISPDVVDQAVNETFRSANVSVDAARVMRSLMGSDTNSLVARAYYHAKALPGAASRSFGVAKPHLEVAYELTDKQAADLVAYAPDFSLRMANSESHDHAVAAACRLVDRALVGSRLPPGAAVSHVGAAVFPLVSSGVLGRGHHACVPVVDRKDPARHVLLNLRVRKIAADSQRSVAVRSAAAGYLAGAVSHVCDKRVQECDYRTPVMTSVHVYDVPMSDWAGVMDRKRCELLEGCLLFPRNLFERSAGEMKVAGARYEVDAAKDVFRMGFVGSPSWWYEHSLTEYLRYGVDQVLCCGGATYSYKVVERRGDTLFFRVLRVSRKAAPNHSQCYRLPGIEMVRVNGFPVQDGRARWLGQARREYLFPRTLWEDMLSHAKECVDRGVLTPERLFNYYRTVAPRQSINAVVVAGGAEVDDMTQLVPLVAHVALFAFMETRRVQIESQHAIDRVMTDRKAAAESTAFKVLSAFAVSLRSMFGLTLAPFRWIAGAKGEDPVFPVEYDWALHPVVQTVGAGLVLSACRGQADEPLADFSSYYRAAAPADLVKTAMKNPTTASFLSGVLGEDLPQEWREQMSAAAVVEGSQVEAGAASPGAGVRPVRAGTVHTLSSGSVTEKARVPAVAVTQEEIRRRKLSILEAIEECDSEAAKSEAACADQFRDLFVGGAPSRQRISDMREQYHNPEFWRVSAGVVESSFSGVPVDGFMHAAVFCPKPCGGSRLLQVTEEEFHGMSQGERVDRVYYKVADADFSGWVYTNDSLLIHNGPAVSEALAAALDRPLDFEVVLHQGPPGCGKTTQIVDTATPEDVVLVPVRKAARETAARMSAKSSALRVVVPFRVRTVDSYLVNVLRNKKLRALSAGRLLADEAFMTREGRWLAAAALLGATVIEAFGDEKQIPHVPRAECAKLYVRLRCQRVVETFVTYRCPPQLVACWGSVYDWKVRSASSVAGKVTLVRSAAGLQVPVGCVMMGMYQADKKLLHEKYARHGGRVKIMTVHESEGNTYKDVWLHRFDMRKRTDDFSLYDRQAYALVAMSRSTHSFVYVAADLGDKVVEFLRQGESARRVAAAQDLSSVGISQEFA